MAAKPIREICNRDLPIDLQHNTSIGLLDFFQFIHSITNNKVIQQLSTQLTVKITKKKKEKQPYIQPLYGPLKVARDMKHWL